MRIHSLAFSALGPFAGEHTIDFDLLGGSSLFLIDGPTGAGKSTIIDAIVFALYGDVAGRASDKQRLRSAFADPGSESFAEIDFSTSAGRFRVRRTPDYVRPKKRGDGTTPVASSVVAYRSTGDAAWEPVSGNKGDADAEIQRWVGLTRAQFLQTVVLPQGEFANFLAAESKDRLTVLERIFATELYSRVEQAFDELRRTAEHERQESVLAVVTAIRDVYSRIPDGQAPPEADLEEPDPEQGGAMARLEALVADVESRLLAQEGVAAELSVELAALDAQLEARRRGDEARRRAADAAAEVTSAAERDAIARAAMDVHRPVLAAVDADPTDPAAAAGVVERALGTLEQAQEAERRLPATELAITEREALLGALDRERRQLDEERDHGLPARLAELASALGSCLSHARLTAERAAEQESALVRARLDGMAGELADALTDDSPCPVCGSIEHPEPAKPSDVRVSLADIDAAVTRRASADQHQHALDLQRERLTQLTEVPSSAGVAEADELSVREVEAAIGELQERSHALAARRGELDVRMAGEAAALDQERQALVEQRALVADAWGGFDSVAQRVAALAAARASLALCVETASMLAMARQGSTTADEELADLVAEFAEAAQQTAPELAERRRELALRAQSAEATRVGLHALAGDLRSRILRAAEAFELRDAVHLRTAEVMSLAGIVRGAEGNRLAQPLSAYVVQSMFDEVLDVANQRLRAMLDGRFELQATEARTSRKLTGLGLGLEVRDLRTDTVRKTSTLSGGESFCASLALALGLADTVRAHAGGIEIGMLFIDEGFGSLDVDRLDDVMSELTRLQADGRTVGVISHVTEMKRTIQERIDVQVLGPHSGSTLTVSWVD